MDKKHSLYSDVSEDGWMMSEGIGTILFYLLMIAVAAGGLYMLFSSSKLTQMQQALSGMTIQIQGLYAGSSSYDGLNNTVAIKAGAVPKNLIKGNAIRTPWGGNVTVSADGDGGTFTVRIEAIPQEDCTKLAVFQLDMWDTVAVNGNAFDSDSGVSTAINSCSGKSNTIVYTSR